MKKSIIKRLVALALVIVSVFSISAVAMAETVKYVNVTPNVNFRETPGGALICRILYGEPVTVLSTTTSGGESWSKCTYDGDTGYIMSKYLSTTKPTAAPTDDYAPYLGSHRSTDDLEEGDSGRAVKNLQLILNDLGYYCGTADGDFGPKTLAQVKAYQKANGLADDGIVGEKTKSALWEDLDGDIPSGVLKI